MNGSSEEKIPVQIENAFSILLILRVHFQKRGLTKRVQQIKQVGFLFHPACLAAKVNPGLTAVHRRYFP